MSTESSQNLLQLNKSKLQQIFRKHSPKEGKISFNDVIKFCKQSKIIPVTLNQDLINLNDFRQSIIGKQSQYAKPQVNYPLFESILLKIAQTIFTKGIPIRDKIKMLLIHIKYQIRQVYKIQLEVPSVNQQVKVKSVQQITNRKQNDSSINLDLNINTALEVLKSPRDESNSSLHMPRVRTPTEILRRQPMQKAKSNRTFAKMSLPESGRHSKIPQRSSLGITKRWSSNIAQEVSNKLANETKELSEFIETEKEIEQNYPRIKHAKSYQEKQIDQITKVLDHYKQKQLKPKKAVDPELLKHRNYLIKDKKKLMEKRMVIGMIFRAWKSLRFTKR